MKTKRLNLPFWSFSKRIPSASWAILLLLLLQSSCTGPKLYQKAYGETGRPGVVFLHGGPGYNSASFEIGAAEKLAEAGYRVVVYDRRGTARSKVKKSKYSFSEASKDLKKVIKKNKLENPTLIGHSFGGAVGTYFSESYPNLVGQLVLVGAPLDYPGTFEAIRAHCRAHYEAIGSDQIKYIDILDTMNTQRLDYATYCFSHAMSCGLYSVDKPSKAAKAIYASFTGDPRAPNLFSMTQKPVRGFHKQHQYTTLDLRDKVAALQQQNIPVYGIYGDQDGLFDEKRLDAIEAVLADGQYFYIKNSSHSVFLDQQAEFIRILQEITGKK